MAAASVVGDVRVLPGALAVAFALLAIGAADGQTHAGGRDVAILVYHPWPDPATGTADADPFSSAGAPPPFPAGRLPFTRVDGALDASDAPEGDPASASAHFQELRNLLLARQRTGAPVELSLAATLRPGGRGMDVRVEAMPTRALGTVVLRAVAFEDDLPFEGGSGVRVHRFVARATAEATLDANGPATRDLALPDVAAGAGRLGVVVSLANATTREVLQSVAWLDGDGPVATQATKSVLIDHATATWCEACAPSDEALALLASQYGWKVETRGGAYAAPWSAWAFIGLAGGAAAGLVLAWRRA